MIARYPALAAAAMWLAHGSSARAEPGERFAAELAIRIGTATAPFHTAALSEVKAEISQALSFVLGGQAAIRDDLAIGGRIPAAPSAIQQPGGSYVDARAFGNPELYAERALALPPIAPWPGRAAVRVAVGIPVAYDGPADTLLSNRSLAVSDAIDGWRNPELYAPGTLPVTASGRATVGRERWRAAAAAKLPVLIRLHDADLPEQANPRPVGFVPHVELAGTWSPLSWLEVGAAAFAVVQAPAAVEPAAESDRTGAVQLGLEPRLAFRAGRAAIATSLFVALGGPLADTVALGIDLRVAP